MPEETSEKPTSDSPGEPDRTPPARQTVRIVKSLAVAAKRIAVLSGKKLESYGTDLLNECIFLIETEINTLSPLGVRDRAERMFAPHTPMGTLNTSPEVATRLASLAGMCLTSVAKLVHPHLGGLLARDNAEISRRAGISHTILDPRPAPEGRENVLRQALVVLDFILIEVSDESLAEFGYHTGDCLITDPMAPLTPGDVVVFKLRDGSIALREIRAPAPMRRERLAGKKPRLITLDQAKQDGVMVLAGVIKGTAPQSKRFSDN